jgi:hypothetical protein
MRTGARRAACSVGEALLRFGAPGKQVVLLHYPVDPRPRSSGSALRSMFETAIPTYEQTLRVIGDATAELGADDLPWANPFLPALDAASLYGFLVSRRPSNYVEIGSGNSTIFARRAIADCGGKTRITSIDPNPRVDVDLLCDRVIRAPLQGLGDMSVFDLSRGDVLFVDGTHQSFPNSDVTVFFTEILPRLRAGVVVGIHDIYLPDDYPEWAAATLPNEQYLLASWLLGRRTMEGVLLPCAFVHRHTDLPQLLKPLWARIGQENPEGGAFWFETP